MTGSHVSRRSFLRQSGALTAWSLTVPAFLAQTRNALKAAPLPGLSDDRVLVLIQLAGGNDGLNTLVPHADDIYYRSRPTLAIGKEKVLRIDDYCGLHPEMYALKELWDNGRLALLQNVGYPNPNLSHFRSTEIWETGSAADRKLASGWIGRYFDSDCRGVPSPTLGMQFGERTAQTFAADHPRCVTLSNPDLFQFSGGAERLRDLERVNRPEATGSGTLDFLLRTGNDVLAVSRQLGEAVGGQQTTADYLPFQFSQTLQLVAKLIAAEVPTRVFYVTLGGFDHHARQKMRHATLLQELSEGIASFVKDLEGLGHLDRTLVMTFSEFGRRVAENRSAGTDHGTASMMFLAGGAVEPGLHGPRADLSKLTTNGDLIQEVDFRSIYATVLNDWLHSDSRKVLADDVSPFEGLLKQKR